MTFLFCQFNYMTGQQFKQQVKFEIKYNQLNIIQMLDKTLKNQKTQIQNNRQPRDKSASSLKFKFQDRYTRFIGKRTGNYFGQICPQKNFNYQARYSDFITYGSEQFSENIDRRAPNIIINCNNIEKVNINKNNINQKQKKQKKKIQQKKKRISNTETEQEQQKQIKNKFQYNTITKSRVNEQQQKAKKQPQMSGLPSRFSQQNIKNPFFNLVISSIKKQQPYNLSSEKQQFEQMVHIISESQQRLPSQNQQNKQIKQIQIKQISDKNQGEQKKPFQKYQCKYKISNQQDNCHEHKKNYLQQSQANQNKKRVTINVLKQVRVTMSNDKYQDLVLPEQFREQARLKYQKQQSESAIQQSQKQVSVRQQQYLPSNKDRTEKVQYYNKIRRQPIQSRLRSKPTVPIKEQQQQHNQNKNGKRKRQMQIQKQKVFANDRNHKNKSKNYNRNQKQIKSKDKNKKQRNKWHTKNQKKDKKIQYQEVQQYQQYKQGPKINKKVHLEGKQSSNSKNNQLQTKKQIKQNRIDAQQSKHIKQSIINQKKTKNKGKPKRVSPLKVKVQKTTNLQENSNNRYDFPEQNYLLETQFNLPTNSQSKSKSKAKSSNKQQVARQLQPDIAERSDRPAKRTRLPVVRYWLGQKVQYKCGKLSQVSYNQDVVTQLYLSQKTQFKYEKTTVDNKIVHQKLLIYPQQKACFDGFKSQKYEYLKISYKPNQIQNKYIKNIEITALGFVVDFSNYQTTIQKRIPFTIQNMNKGSLPISLMLQLKLI